MIGFPSAPASGPFHWRVIPKPGDRLRYMLHQSVMVPSTRLGLRGGPRLSLLLRRLVGDYHEPVVAEAEPDVRLSFSGFDRYWMRVFFRGDFYEPELDRLFRRIRRLHDFDFIDGGANIGFWSAVLTSQRFGVRRAIAIEASPTTYADLERTAALCGGRFATEHCALSARPGTVSFEQGVVHESRRIVAEGSAGSTSLVTVKSTTVDDLVDRHQLATPTLIVKLDVEGAELDCVRGGANAFDRGAVFIYEEHGKEPTSVLTANLLELGAACWFIDDAGALHPVTSAAEASRFKTQPERGYNFLCTSAAFAAEHPLEPRLFG